MGFLRDDIELFVKTKSAEVLRMIYEKHGKRGFSLACRAAGIKRGQGKRMIGIYNDAGVIEQLAARCGLRKTGKSLYGFDYRLPGSFESRQR